MSGQPDLRARIQRWGQARQLFKTEWCKFYQEGLCEKGDACSYAHGPYDLRAKPDLTHTSLCRAWVNEGRCADPFCRFAHSEIELKGTSGFFKMKMCGYKKNCRNGENCRFAHSVAELRRCTRLLRGGEGAPPAGGHTGVAEDPSAGEVQAPAAQSPAAGTSRHRWSDVQDSSGSDAALCAENFEEGPRSDSPSDHSGTTAYSGESGRPVAPGTRAPGGPSRRTPAGDQGLPLVGELSVGSDAGGPDVGGDSAEATTCASSGEQMPATKHTRRVLAKAGSPSTLLVSNIPDYFTQGSLLAMFEDLMPAMRDGFDFFYCPYDQESMRNLGYATVNFTSRIGALAFQQAWSDRPLCPSEKQGRRIIVMEAPLQGLEANVEYAHRVASNCRDPRFRPMLRDETGALGPLAPAGPAAPAECSSSFAPPCPSQQDALEVALPGGPRRAPGRRRTPQAAPPPAGPASPRRAPRGGRAQHGAGRK